MTRFICIDPEHNTYQCAECGYITTFEADGPFENGVDFCPACGDVVEHPREEVVGE